MPEPFPNSPFLVPVRTVENWNSVDGYVPMLFLRFLTFLVLFGDESDFIVFVDKFFTEPLDMLLYPHRYEGDTGGIGREGSFLLS